MNRASGILMPITSLPSPYGIGTIGKAAYEFADFLKRAGQSYWQILPVGPTSYGDSPYQSFSTYAGNPYMIGYFVNNGGEHFAGAAPGGPEVYEHGLRGLYYFSVKIVLCYNCNCHNYHPL